MHIAHACRSSKETYLCLGQNFSIYNVRCATGSTVDTKTNILSLFTLRRSNVQQCHNWDWFVEQYAYSLAAVHCI